MDDPWSAFPVSSPDAPADPWAQFPVAKGKGKGKRGGPTLDSGTVTGTVDGDTLRASSGRSVRVYGVDAPELRQQGQNAQGQPIPIGQQSRNALAGLVVNSDVTLGAPVGESYGRPVAPLTADGLDVGRDLARYGNALAAPEYLAADPARRFDYMQAERLARQNGLGIHATRFQPPADFRKAPLPVDQLTPDRSTTAMFWDTPTPMAGMRPEVEKRFLAMLNDHSVPPDKVAAFARENGFVVDPARVVTTREQSTKRGLPIAMNYIDPPKVLTDQGDGAFGAAVRGVGNGVLPNWLEETGAVVDTLGATPGRENVWNSDRRLADIWANNAAQNESITAHDRFAHPYAEGVGELAGGLVPFIPALKAEATAANLAKIGGAYGFAVGTGREGSVPERLTSGVVGAGEGIATTVLGGKALEAAAPLLEKGWRWVRGAKGPKLVPPAGEAPAPIPAQAMAADAGSATSMEVPRPQSVDRPLTEAQMQARAADIHPNDVTPIPANEIGSVEEAAAKDAGRYTEAKPVNERAQLSRQTVRAWNGAEVPKVGPIDMVGWLRSQGGLADQGGELSHMGLTNAARQGMDFVGQEQRFGPLVNPQGLNLDDAAMRAWEAGYFPERTERPSVNEFLDALRDTYEGRNRRFLPQDHAEIDRFHGAQADRYALEQQLQDGPVWKDRSAPAGPDQPFAPPEAYEEWPAGGPDFAGNINLNKLDTPQDIRRALSATEQRVGFDAATRGRVTQAETERLAADLGMTPERLLSRRKGQALNAEEALAARQILAKSGNELVNLAKRIKGMDEPGDDLLAEFRQAWVRHAALQEQVAGATAEAGRALAQFKMMASSKAVRSDVLSAMVGSGGGRDRIRDAAETLLETVEAGPGAFNTIVEKGARPKLSDKLVELWINWLLTSPATHAVNMTSNTLTALAQLPEHAVAAGIGGARRFVGRGEDAVTGQELGVRAFALLQGAKEGARLFAQALRTGEPSDLVAKVEGIGMKAISGKKGEIVRIPTRFLTAEDELFKGIARRMEINGQAVRIARGEGLKGEALKRRIAELSDYPTDAMLQRSMDYARYLTFQRKLGPLASKVSAGTSDAPVLKLFLPFVRTPTNLLKFAAERSPAAPLLKEWRADFRAGGARRDLAVAKALVGTGMGMAIYEAALQGKITGSAPTDPAKARLMYADGFQPYSIRIGDKWYSYKRLDPFSTTLGVAADMALLPEGMSPRQQDDKATLLIASILGNLANKTWLSGLSDLLGAITDPEQNADDLVQRLGGSLAVPTGVAQIARTTDPVQRKVDSVGEAIKARVPGLSKGLLPRRDVWGREVTSEGGVGPDIASPIYTSTAENDPVNRALLDAGVSIGLPSRKVGGRELTPEEYDRYQADAGERAYRRVKAFVSSDAWKGMDDEARQETVSKLVSGARKEARAALFNGAAEDDAWSAFPSATRAASKTQANDPWASFPKPDQPDVLGELQRAIPGATFTSGYRTPEYQAEMRRRGYHPADNSGHLDGSALDIVPPRGKSIGWLAEQVKRVHPSARLLPEGDHLHVTFPGWFGAPVIGGAKAARLVNPNAGQ